MEYEATGREGIGRGKMFNIDREAITELLMWFDNKELEEIAAMVESERVSRGI